MKNISRRNFASSLAFCSFLFVKKDTEIRQPVYNITDFKIDVGDIVFVEGFGFTSSIIKNYQKDFMYTHVGIAVNIDGCCLIIDSNFGSDVKYDGVYPKSMEVFIGESINVLIMKNKRLSSKIKDNISKYAIEFIGTNFDFKLIWGNKEMYCTELLYNIIKKSMSIDNKISLQEILTPQLFHRFISTAGWSPVFASRA